MTTPLTQEQIREELHYNPKTGLFTRLVARCNKVKVGDLAGAPDSHGYIQIRVLGRLHLAHRLAWLYTTGEWPEGGIDHRNTIRDDNRWSNLRKATRFQNGMNSRRNKNSTTMEKNIVVGERGRYRVRVTTNGVRQHVGWFKTIPEAKAAHERAVLERHGAFGRTS
jgi:hypothetical protein